MPSDRRPSQTSTIRLSPTHDSIYARAIRSPSRTEGPVPVGDAARVELEGHGRGASATGQVDGLLLR